MYKVEIRDLHLAFSCSVAEYERKIAKKNLGGDNNIGIAVLLESAQKKKKKTVISNRSNRSEQLALVQRRALPVGGLLKLLVYLNVRKRNLSLGSYRVQIGCHHFLISDDRTEHFFILRTDDMMIVYCAAFL